MSGLALRKGGDVRGETNLFWKPSLASRASTATARVPEWFRFRFSSATRENTNVNEGRIFPRGNKWWIGYCIHGKEYRESSGSTEAEARRKLTVRLGEKYSERFIGPEQSRVPVNELLDSLALHLQLRGAKALASHRSHVKPVRQFFGRDRVADVTSKRIEAFIATELTVENGRRKAAASVNRELAALRSAFNLARKQGRISHVPYFPMLRENNARQGFFERKEFESVVANLPDDLADATRFAYLSGWRKGEILPLTWEAVDRAGKEVRLATSKNDYGRVLPLEGELLVLIERRWAARSYMRADDSTAISNYVFHRKGKRIWKMDEEWKAACEKAKVPGRLFHDLRRTAVRNMIRAGVPQSVAMSITGHRTISMFLRYNITSDHDMREALRKTQAHVAAQFEEQKVVDIGRLGQNSDSPKDG
jgi:integrase